MSQWEGGEGNYVQVRRDPFAREDLMREAIGAKMHSTTCAWCGQTRKHGGLFHYGVSRDDRPEIAWDSKLFCSIGCRDTYYE